MIVSTGVSSAKSAQGALRRRARSSPTSIIAERNARARSRRISGRSSCSTADLADRRHRSDMTIDNLNAMAELTRARHRARVTVASAMSTASVETYDDNRPLRRLS
ncbi:MAG: hypothetical protein MZU97_00365 [Bacillus subtilis]|nr:hypothetical protein [Bacillus subtilis]